MEGLGINWGLLIAQLFNVIILVVLLSRFLYKPVLNMLNERTERVQASLREADQVKTQIASAQQDYEAQISRGRQEAASIVAQAQERAKSQEVEIVAQARGEADRIRAEARQQSVQERDQLLREVKGQMASLITATAEKVIGAELRTNHDQLIDESLAQLGRQNTLNDVRL